MEVKICYISILSYFYIKSIFYYSEKVHCILFHMPGNTYRPPSILKDFRSFRQTVKSTGVTSFHVPAGALLYVSYHIYLIFSCTDSSSPVIICFQKLLDLLPYIFHNSSPDSFTRYTSGNSLTFTLFMCTFFVVFFQKHF